MKIAITSSGSDLTAAVDQRFGRAAMFVLYDVESGKFEVFDNKQNLNAAQGAGIQAAQKVFNMGADAIITGHCGPKAFAALNAAGVKVYCGANGTIESTINQYKEGGLTVSIGADVEGHWV